MFLYLDPVLQVLLRSFVRSPPISFAECSGHLRRGGIAGLPRYFEFHPSVNGVGIFFGILDRLASLAAVDFSEHATFLESFRLWCVLLLINLFLPMW